MIPRSLLSQALSSLLSGGKEEPFHMVTVLANASAFLYEQLEDVSWAGFYLLEGDNLFLGPFQGKVACTKIPLGKGVCGTCARKETTIIVPDVHRFVGHIACDCESRSEIVVPLFLEGKLFGVMDLDSKREARFTKEDASLLEEVSGVVERALSGT